MAVSALATKRRREDHAQTSWRILVDSWSWGWPDSLWPRSRLPGPRAERAVHPDGGLPRRPLRRGRHRHLRRVHRLSRHVEQARRRNQRRQADLGGVRDRVQERPGRRVLREAEEEGPDGRRGVQLPLDRNHLRVHRARHGRQDPRRLDRLRPHRRLRRPRLPLRLPARDELLEPEHRQDQVHRDEGRRDGQVEGEEDRQPLPRLGLRQGDDPDPGPAGQEVRLHGDAHRGRPSRQRAGIAVAADPSTEARLGDPARLGRHEPGRPEDRRQGRLSRGTTSSASGGAARRRTSFRRGTPPRASSRPPSIRAARTSRFFRTSRSTSTPEGTRETSRTSRASD